jgi:hypothetical protein
MEMLGGRGLEEEERGRESDECDEQKVSLKGVDEKMIWDASAR